MGIGISAFYHPREKTARNGFVRPGNHAGTTIPGKSFSGIRALPHSRAATG